MQPSLLSPQSLLQDKLQKPSLLSLCQQEIPELPWQLNSCNDLQELFGLYSRESLKNVFDKVQKISLDESGILIRQPLTLALIKRISAFPEYQTYLKSSSIDAQNVPRLEELDELDRYRKQAAMIVALLNPEFAKQISMNQPECASLSTESAAIALIQFIESGKNLPKGRRLQNFQYFLQELEQNLYQHNLILIHHNPNTEPSTALETLPKFLPCVDILRQHLEKLPANKKYISLETLNMISQLEENIALHFINELRPFVETFPEDICLEFAKNNPDKINLVLTLSEHYKGRFTLWKRLMEAVPEKAAYIMENWIKELPRLADEKVEEKNAFTLIQEDKQLGAAYLQNVPVEEAATTHIAEETPSLSTRHIETRTPSRTHRGHSAFFLKRAIQFSTFCIENIFIGYSFPFIINEINKNRNKGIPLEKVVFKDQYHVKLANRGFAIQFFREDLDKHEGIFADTGNEYAHDVYLNVSRAFFDEELMQKLKAHLIHPTMSDQEFYEQYLYTPNPSTQLFSYLKSKLNPLSWWRSHPPSPSSNPSESASTRPSTPS